MAEIDLVLEELRELARPVIDAAGSPPEPFGVYIFAPDEPESELARFVERAVFGQWYGNTAELLSNEYDPYEKSAMFCCVLDHRRALPAGMARVGLPAPMQCKSFDDIERIWGTPIDGLLAATGSDWDRSRTWDSMTIAVADDYRGKATDGLISLALLQTGTQGMRQAGAAWTVTILDLNVLGMIQELLHEPYQRFPGIEPMAYLDSPQSLPVYLDLDEWEPRLRALDPIMHALIFEGLGIEPAVRPPAWAPLLRVLGLNPRPTSVTR